MTFWCTYAKFGSLRQSRGRSPQIGAQLSCVLEATDQGAGQRWVAAAAILLLPTSWVAALDLAPVRKQYGALLGIAAVLAMAVLIIEAILFTSAWLRTRERRMPYERYRKDEFFGLRWRWHWYGGEVVGPRAFCPACDLQLEGWSRTTGIMDTPSDELRYRCPCGLTDVKLQAPSPQDLGHVIKLCAERKARERGLLRD